MWIPEDCQYPARAKGLGLKIPRGHVIAEHPDGESREGLIWCEPAKPKKKSSPKKKKAPEPEPEPADEPSAT